MMTQLSPDIDWLHAQGDISFPASELERLEKRKWILQHVPVGGSGAEIGVFRGHFSAILADVLKPKLFYLVDPWTKLGEKFGWGEVSEYTGRGKLTTRYAIEDTKRRIAFYLTTVDVRLVEEYAIEFLSELRHKLSWVYLDASHDYESTLTQLHAIDRVMAQNGFICGDDWQSNPFHNHHGVYRAIQEFVHVKNWEIMAAGPAAQWCLCRCKNWYLDTKLSPVGNLQESGRFIETQSIDELPPSIDEKQPLSLSGVVVLRSDTVGTFRLIAVDRFGDHAVHWRIRSPLFAKRYPGNPHAAHSRFRVDGLRIGSDDQVNVFVEDDEGRRERVVRIALKNDV